MNDNGPNHGIHRLPNELLGKIFAFSTASIAPSPFLMVVCKIWRGILFDTPECWTHLRISSSTAFLAPLSTFSRVLAASGSLPLHLAINIPAGSDEERIRTVAGPLSAHIYRVQSLRLSAADEIYCGLFLGILLRPTNGVADRALALEELIIRLDAEDGGIIEDEVFDDYAPVGSSASWIIARSPYLHVVQLPAYQPCIPRVPAGIAPSNITSLTLAAAGAADTSSASGILSFVAYCAPHLQTLVYTTPDMEWDLFPYTGTEKNVEEIPGQPISLPIPFPELSRAVVSCPTTASTLLDVIDAPKLSNVTLDARDILGPDYGSEWGEWADARILRVLERLASRSPDVKALELSGLPLHQRAWDCLLRPELNAVDISFKVLETLVIDESDMESIFGTDKLKALSAFFLGRTIGRPEGHLTVSPRPTLRRLHLRSLQHDGISEHTLSAFVSALRSQPDDKSANACSVLPLELVIEDCPFLVENELRSRLGTAGDVRLEFFEERQDDRFPRRWPHPRFPQRPFWTLDPFEDDSHLWGPYYDDSDEEEDADPAIKDEATGPEGE